MACDMRIRQDQTLAERGEEIKRSLARLEQALLAGGVKVAIGSNGAVAFAGWKTTERSDVTDACAYRLLAVSNSWALRQAVQRAEAMQGRKVNPQAVAAGWHSHDGGKSWGTHSR